MSWWQKKKKDRVKEPPAQRWLIAGLGNPGRKYEKSWHNLGYLALDLLAQRHGIKIDRLRFGGLMGQGLIAGQKVILLKPMTYMNNSGLSLQQAASYYKIGPEKIIVLLDDIDINTGKIRLREQGSAGSHKGLKSVIRHLGSDEFYRVRIGMGPRPEGDMVEIVLADIPVSKSKEVELSLNHASEAVETLLSSGLELAQSRYN